MFGLFGFKGFLRKRLSLGLWLQQCYTVVKDMSRQRNPSQPFLTKLFKESTDLSTQLNRAAYDWLKDPSTNARMKVDGTYYYSKARHSSETELTSAEIKRYKQVIAKPSFVDFKEYTTLIGNIRCTRLDTSEFQNSTCSCPEYFKSYICKHIVGIAAMTKLYRISSEAKTVPIGKKPGPGRPAKTKPALQYQDAPPAKSKKRKQTNSRQIATLQQIAVTPTTAVVGPNQDAELALQHQDEHVSSKTKTKKRARLNEPAASHPPITPKANHVSAAQSSATNPQYSFARTSYF